MKVTSGLPIDNTCIDNADNTCIAVMSDFAALYGLSFFHLVYRQITLLLVIYHDFMSLMSSIVSSWLPINHTFIDCRQ